MCWGGSIDSYLGNLKKKNGTDSGDPLQMGWLRQSHGKKHGANVPDYIVEDTAHISTWEFWSGKMAAV